MKLVPLIKPPSIVRRAAEAGIVLGILALVMAGAWWAYGYFAGDAAAEQIDVYVALDEPLCSTRTDSPVFIGVINNSDRTIVGMTFVLEARAGSDGPNLQSDFTYTDNNRIVPGAAMGDCWPANYKSADTHQKVRARDLDWRILRRDLTFAD